MVKLFNRNVNAVVRTIKKRQKKGKIRRLEETELEAIRQHLNSYALLCAIPERKLDIYHILAENSEEFVFKILTKDFEERWSEVYSKRQRQKEIQPFFPYTDIDPNYIHEYDPDGLRKRFLRIIKVKEDPDLVNRVTSTKRFEGEVLGIVDDGDYRVIAQTNEGYRITTLDPNTLEEKASEDYLMPTKQDKRRAIPYKVSAGLGGLAIILSPYVLMLLGAREGIVNSLRVPTVAAAVGVWMSMPFVGSKKYKRKKTQMMEFNEELYKYAKIT